MDLSESEFGNTCISNCKSSAYLYDIDDRTYGTEQISQDPECIPVAHQKSRELKRTGTEDVTGPNSHFA